MSTFISSRVQGIFVVLLLVLGLQACSNHNALDTNTLTKNKPIYHIYLAGPEVFLPDPVGAGIAKKNKIEQLNQQNNWPFTLIGLYPLDNEIEGFAPDFTTGMKIYHANIALMDKADYITANMVRFRGPSMDVGTAFEMGYMAGLNKPVFAYYDAKPFYGKDEQAGLYAERIAKFYPVSADKEGVDIHGQAIENFQMADNLMMVGSLESGIGKISDDFERAVLDIAEHIQSRQK
jgi:nucleoside 2-deoxyribosyltransferase